MPGQHSALPLRNFLRGLKGGREDQVIRENPASREEEEKKCSPAFLLLLLLLRGVNSLIYISTTHTSTQTQYIHGVWGPHSVHPQASRQPVYSIETWRIGTQPLILC